MIQIIAKSRPSLRVWADAAVFVCNRHSLKSWESVAGWYSYLDTVEKADNCIVVLVLNKIDKPSTLDMNLVEWHGVVEDKEAVHSVVEINDDNQEARKLKKKCC